MTFSLWTARAAVLLAVVLVHFGAAQPAEAATRFYIFSGQSNMKHVDLKLYRTLMEKAHPGDNILISHFAQSGQPIRLWYDDWEAPGAESAPGVGANGRLYDKLMENVRQSVQDQPRPDHVTFLWMQGENDTAEKAHAAVYRQALEGVLAQLERDLERKDIKVVLGRICDEFSGNPENAPGWDEVRQAQSDFAQAQPGNRRLVDTDDLSNPNDGDVHFFKRQSDGRSGYVHLTERFAAAALELEEGS